VARLEGYVVEIIATKKIKDKDLSCLKTLQKEMEVLGREKNYQKQFWLICFNEELSEIEIKGQGRL